MSLPFNGDVQGSEWNNQAEDSEVAGFVNKTFEILGVPMHQSRSKITKRSSIGRPQGWSS